MLEGSEAGKPGRRFSYKIWTQACKNLDLMRSETRPIVDLYAGTRHSTMTAMAEVMSPEEIQQASGHRTNAALMRYLQGRARYAQKAGTAVLKIQGKARGQVIKLPGGDRGQASGIGIAEIHDDSCKQF